MKKEVWLMAGEDDLKLSLAFGCDDVLECYEPRVQSSPVSQILHPSRMSTFRHPINGRINPQDTGSNMQAHFVNMVSPQLYFFGYWCC